MKNMKNITKTCKICQIYITKCMSIIVFQKNLLSKEKLEIVPRDVFGKIMTLNSGQRYVLVTTDLFTKYI